MNVDLRKKLVEILSVPIFPFECADPAEVVADYLIDNDVIPVGRCHSCAFYKTKEKLCFRKVHCGGFHSVDKVTPNFFCAAWKDKNGEV